MTASRRLFFALALPESICHQVVDWRAGHFPIETGRPVAAGNLHLTLAFLGDVSADKERALRAAAIRLQQKSFTFTLDDCGHWPGSGVVWLGMRRAPRGLLQLAQWLRSRAARSGCYQHPLPFHPHITLFRQATHAVALPPAAPGWHIEADSFGLYASSDEHGRRTYKLLQNWPLAPQEGFAPGPL
ncbi:RNA 2',3'-cyclic phosphodiesterase [Acerihabitans sp. TG2]|uniref:RNA 2',3'-cyclic phosphodiesterase n=1 Tax=Acerihabitans sp. TG2 TaxID=3096008 RepID=UPI002B2256AA|nr:RNA 2',3'-cyclic phosphodiesterase [Acerihabitans sp. TG2]MEA9391831.1 RNA 2',3'-cyclic phosphodiesterase [Acerihabitans sp. TG2]